MATTRSLEPPVRPVRGTGGAPARGLTAEREAIASVDRAAPHRGPVRGRLGDSERLAGVGRPLPDPLRIEEEARLGADLSAVRLHDGPEAQALIAETSARALTLGQGIAMAPQDARADSRERRDLLRHELAHAVQQALPGAMPQIQRQERPDPDGIGGSPPDLPFVTMDTEGAEDDHILFAPGTADLTPAAGRALAGMAAAHGSAVTVHIHGYASLEGSRDYNRNLSAHRAAAVRAALIDILPPATEFHLFAHGETSDFGARQLNRRAGIDFIAREEPTFLAGGFGSRERPRINLLGGDRLQLRPPDLSGAPRPPVQLYRDSEPPTAWPNVGLPPGWGVHPDPVPPGLVPPAPARIGLTEFDYSGAARLFSARGMQLTPGYGRDLENHYTFWRDRYIEWGLPPAWAASAAQAGTDYVLGTHLRNQHPTRFEDLDRRLGTDPMTLSISDSHMRAGYEYLRRMLRGRQ